MSIIKHITAAFLFSAFGIAYAAEEDHSAYAQHTEVASPPMSEGEVRKIDLDAGKVTLRHGRLANLNMPGMTMVFTAQDTDMLAGLDEGNQIRFVAERINDVYTIVQLEKK